MKKPDIGENVWNKPSYNYEWLFQVRKKTVPLKVTENF